MPYPKASYEYPPPPNNDPLQNPENIFIITHLIMTVFGILVGLGLGFLVWG